MPGDPCKLFVGGLGLSTTSIDLAEYMRNFGELSDAMVMLNKETGQSRGFGFCTFRNSTDASRALNTPLHMIDGVNVAVRVYQQQQSPAIIDYISERKNLNSLRIRSRIDFTR